MLNGRMLHVAPERSLARKFRKAFDYLSIDIDGARAMQAADVTKLPFPDNHFDAVVASHVLEHVAEDRKAIGEFFRVLKPGGWAALLVPMTQDAVTDEDPNADPQERRRRFGQEDHVRMYGRDYLERLRDGGFRVTEYRWKDFMTPSEADLYVIHADEEMIFGWK